MGERHLSMALYALALCGVAAAPALGAAAMGNGLGPCALAASRDGTRLYVANADARQIAFVDARNGAISRRVGVPREPTGLALSPDGGTLYVSCAGAQGTVLAVNAASGKVEATIPAGHTPTSPVASPDGRRLYVCTRFSNAVSVIDLEAHKEVARVPTTREPFAAAITPDGRSLLVANHLPADRADGRHVAAVVTVIDTLTRRTTAIRLPNGACGLRGICVSPDGRYAYVTHILARYELPTTQVDCGWINANALSLIDTAARKRLGTVLLDDLHLGAANPWGVGCTADGKWLCVAHAGTHELSVIDAPALVTKLLAVPVHAEPAEMGEVIYDDRNEVLDCVRHVRAELAGETGPNAPHHRRLYLLGDAAGVSNDLSFLAGLRRRITLGGNGPRGLAVVGATVYVAEHFTDTLSVVDLRGERGKRVKTVPLGPRPRPTARRRGEMLFHDATHCFARWQSCASCHPGGRMDGLHWDLLNDGMANLKNTRSLLLAHSTPPAMSTGVRASAEAAVRAGVEHILFGRLPERDAAAIDAYLTSLQPVPSPRLANGRLSPAARRGKALFFRRDVGCATCHPPPLYTDLRPYDVGTKSPWDCRRAFDTPTLIEVWRTAPYLHDGRYTTLKELFAPGGHGKQHGAVETLSEQQIDDLVEFVLSL